MGDQTGNKSNIQLIWGIALVLVGIGVFVRVPQVMPELAKIQQFAGATGFIRICFYLMGIILIGGGVKKLIRYIQLRQESSKAPPDDRTGE